MPSSSQDSDGPGCRCTTHPGDPPGRHSAICPVYKEAHAEHHIEGVAEEIARRLWQISPVRRAVCRTLFRLSRWLLR